MLEEKVWDPPVERMGIPENAMIVATRMLISIKHFEDGPDAWEVKGRSIGLGHLYWTKYLRLRRYIRQRRHTWR